MPGMTVIATNEGGGFDLRLELASDRMLPGRLVDGTFVIATRRGGSFRGARITLVGTETWRYDVTTTDSQGHTRTETRTGRKELPNVPIAVLGPVTMAAGETREVPFQLPVPGLGPATFEGTELRVDWEISANLDVAGFDPGVSLPVVLLQPTALLRAGVVTVAQFALYPAADGAADGIRGSIWLDPSPLLRRRAVRGPAGPRDAGRAQGPGGPPRTAGAGQGDGRWRPVRNDHDVGGAARPGPGEFGGGHEVVSRSSPRSPSTCLPTVESRTDGPTPSST